MNSALRASVLLQTFAAQGRHACIIVVESIGKRHPDQPELNTGWPPVSTFAELVVFHRDASLEYYDLLQRMRAQLQSVTNQRDILKKAVGIFAGPNGSVSP